VTEQLDINDFKQKLIDFFTKFAAVAEKSVGKVRFFALLSTLSAVWLTYYFYQLFSLSTGVTIALVFILAIPALFLFKLYGALSEVIELPERIGEVLDNLKESGFEAKEKVMNQIASAKEGNQKRPKFRDIFKMARLFLQIKGILAEATELTEVMGSALLLSSPPFMILSAISTATTLLLTLTSIITALIFIF
jgi:hypothetical protein